LAPAKTSEEDIRRVNQAVIRGLGEPAIKERFSQLGLLARGGTPAELATLIQKELNTMSCFAKFAKISLD
jgi:tripartite-type tricarboxylate transporter receptor subunit TctC